MKIYEFGNRNNPVLMLLPGTCCLWNDNFGHVIDKLKDKFFVACVSYDGFFMKQGKNNEYPDKTDDAKKPNARMGRAYTGYARGGMRFAL